MSLKKDFKMMTYRQRSQKIFQAMLEGGATHLSRDILKAFYVEN